MRFASLWVLLGLVACTDSTGPAQGVRLLGILQMQHSPAEAAASSEVDSGVQWSPAPGEDVVFPPVALEAPAVVTEGVPFGVVAHTVGPNACWSAHGINVDVAERTVELLPWDWHSGDDACAEVLLFLRHYASVSLDAPGEWTVRVRGRRVSGAEAATEAVLDASSIDAVTAQRIVRVRAPSSGALPNDATLAPGEAASFGPFEVTFSGVGEDSRCPVDVECVWQGNAEVELGLTVGSGPTVPVTVNTGDGPVSAEHGGYRVTLLGVEPQPESDMTIEAGDYRAHLWVEAP